MRNTNKGFTLVELIVVITILAILGTIAFISLQGYSQDAKNSKVSSDLRSLTTSIETGITKGDFTLLSINDNSASSTNEVLDTATITYRSSTWANLTGALSTVTYEVGNVDFTALRQNGDDFKDPEDKDYLIGTASTGSTAYYQLVGQTKNSAGTYNAVVKGNYIAITAATDLGGLVEAADNSGFGTWVVNNDDLGTAGLY